MPVGEWDQRQLCPDGGCIGVIGPDGTCKVCGRAAPNWGEERKRGLIEDVAAAAEDEAPAWDDSSSFHGRDDEKDLDDDDADEDDEDDEDDEGDDDDGDEGDGDEESASAAAPRRGREEWSGRELCPDGACIGVIGPDGACKVCGKRRTGASKSSRRDSTAPRDAAAARGSASTSTRESAATGDSAATSTREAAAASAGDSSSAIGGVLADPGDDWGERKLCSDPTCVGVSGLDGRCKVCGKECL